LHKYSHNIHQYMKKLCNKWNKVFSDLKKCFACCIITVQENWMNWILYTYFFIMIILSFIIMLPFLFDVILVLYHQIKINLLYICPENINELSVINKYISLLFVFICEICFIFILTDYITDKTNPNLYVLLYCWIILNIYCFFLYYNIEYVIWLIDNGYLYIGISSKSPLPSVLFQI